MSSEDGDSLVQALGAMNVGPRGRGRGRGGRGGRGSGSAFVFRAKEEFTKKLVDFKKVILNKHNFSYHFAICHN